MNPEPTTKPLAKFRPTRASGLGSRASFQPTTANRQPPTANRGSVLILCLWALAVLAALAVASASHLTGALRLTGFLNNDLQASMAARGGVEYALMAAVSQTGRWDGVVHLNPADPEQPLRIGPGGRVRVTHAVELMDEEQPVAIQPGMIGTESCLNLNSVSAPLLAALIETAAGEAVAARQAAEWATRFITLRENARLTNDTSISYDGRVVRGMDSFDAERPVFRSWHDVHSLAGEAGINPAVIKRIRPHATVFGNGLINVNSAGLTVLTALGMAGGGNAAAARELAAAMVAYRNEGGVFEEDGGWVAALSPLDEEQVLLLNMMMSPPDGEASALTVRSSCFMGTAKGWTVERGDADRRAGRNDDLPPLKRWIDFVISRQPPEVLYWHEY